MLAQGTVPSSTWSALVGVLQVLLPLVCSGLVIITYFKTQATVKELKILPNPLRVEGVSTPVSKQELHDFCLANHTPIMTRLGELEKDRAEGIERRRAMYGSIRQAENAAAAKLDDLRKETKADINAIYSELKQVRDLCQRTSATVESVQIQNTAILAQVQALQERA